MYCRTPRYVTFFNLATVLEVIVPVVWFHQPRFAIFSQTKALLKVKFLCLSFHLSLWCFCTNTILKNSFVKSTLSCCVCVIPIQYNFQFLFKLDIHFYHRPERLILENVFSLTIKHAVTFDKKS